jgi:ribosome-associated heat shock protein Hsp15
LSIAQEVTMTAAGDIPPVRADKWLWAARFYKTRSLAMAAINGGKVHLNGERIKPARKLVVGDRLTVQKSIYTFVITIDGLSLQRGPAAVAQTLYSESDESREARQLLKETQKLQGDAGGPRQGRPDKRARRQIHQFRTRQLK